MSTPAPSEMKSVRELHDAFDRKALSAEELTKRCLADARAKSQLNAVLELCEERALAQARAADARIARAGGKVPRAEAPLLGVPLGIKDLLVIDGVRTTCASRMLENYRPPYTATAVARLENAGAVTLAKLNLDEFAMGGSNENSAFGPVRHPTHPDRVPGGSSGGSAAAVRAGFCHAALGTDTGGSIRLPASYCGVVGFKPTYGTISRYGLVAFASSFDQIGPLARSVDDAALLTQVMSGHDPLDSTSAPRPPLALANASAGAGKLRIGLPKEFFVGGLQPEVEQSVQEAIRSLERLGATVVPVSLPHTKYAVSVYYLVAISEASSNLSRFDGVRFGVRPPSADSAHSLAEYYSRARGAFGPEVKRRIILGTFALSSGYADAYYRRACQVRRLVQQDFDKAFSDVDLIAGPVSPTTAFRLGEKASDPLQMYLNDIFTIPANLAGLPAISVPCGQDAQGLPIGLHLMARPFEDARLLAAAAALEKARAAG